MKDDPIAAIDSKLGYVLLYTMIFELHACSVICGEVMMMCLLVRGHRAHNLKMIESVDEEGAAGALNDTRHGKSNTS
jgi:hypothetical protein